jgi:hypothetical protein
MKMKNIYLIASLMAFSLFVSCNEDPCDNVNCLNNGFCVNGTCDCPVNYTGPTCSDQKTPSVIRLTAITVTKFPGSNNGASWDPVSNTFPDIFPVITDNNNDIILLNLINDWIENADPSNSYTFNLPANGFEFPNVNANYNILLYDYDGTSDLDFMGGINGSIYNNNGGFPNSLNFSTNDFSFELQLNYVW